MSQASLPVVDLIIPTRNRPDLIGTALQSVRDLRGVDVTIWVVDQSDDERTRQVVEAHAATDPRLRYIHTQPRGISAARNLGISLGTAPYVLFTDDDCRVEPGWAQAMVAAFATPQIWAVFGRILPDHTDGQHTVDRLPGLDLATKLNTDPALYQRNRFNLSFGHGASMGLRRSSWGQLGGFDEALGVGGPLRSWEDRDFGYRILTQGYQIAYTPHALLYHRQWRSWPEVRRSLHNYAIGTGAAAGKHLRYGDLGGLVLLGEWLFSQGLRQVVSGVFKWRSWPKAVIGLQQLTVPWYGLLLSLRVPLARSHRVYDVSGLPHKRAAKPTIKVDH
ncbi:MAG: glycosyltransferase family 2 protein [Oscillochloridaceae bacterium umkhey_bin13]